MTEDNLQRLDTALRLLAVVSQDLRNLRALMTQPEPEMEPEPVQKENGELTLEGARPLQDFACL